METRKIESLRNQHQVQRAWIFGKGPSLDSFDMNTAGTLRICINESLWRVPNPTYVFAHDEKPIQRIAKNWPHGCTAILEPSRAKYAVQCGIPQAQIATYEKRQVSHVESLEQVIANASENELLGNTGTVHSAIHFCKWIGATHISMIGFDGAGGYAASLELATPIGGGQHDRIRKDSIRLLKALEMDFDFGEKTDVARSSHFNYQELYDRLREAGYHDSEDQSSHLAPHIGWITNHLRPATALDIGCSAGKSIELFHEAGIEATGVEVSKIAAKKARSLNRNVVCASATDLPFEDDSFDLVCSADVFEHLHPNDAQKACQEAARVSRKYIFMKIAEREDSTEKWKQLAGHPLHLTTEKIAWWKKHFRSFKSIQVSSPEVLCLEKLETTASIDC